VLLKGYMQSLSIALIQLTRMILASVMSSE
jgi:hypothetical protein